MAVRPVKVEFGADDRVTGVVDRINKRLALMRAPAERAGRSLSRFADLSGLNKIRSGVSNVGRSAESAFLSLGRMVPVLGTLTGAASIAGVYKLATAWADFGSRLGFTAQRLGMLPQALQASQGAARLAGSSAASFTSGMATLQEGLFDAVGGRNPRLVSAFNTLHMQFRDIRGRALSVAQVLPQLADKIKAIRDPAGQAAVATEFFGGAAEDLLPFLRLGSAGIARYTATAAKYGVTNQAGVQAANRLRVAQTDLNLSVEGFGNTLAQTLEPALTPVIERMAMLVNQGRLWVAANLPGTIKEFEAWCKRTWPQVDQVAKSLGGWKAVGKDALEVITALYAARVLLGLGRLASVLTGVSGSLGLIGKTLPLLSGIMLLEKAHNGRAPTAKDLREHPELFTGISPEQRAKIAATPASGDPGWIPQWAERFDKRLNQLGDRLRSGGVAQGIYHRVMGETRRLNPTQELSDVIDAASGLKGVDPAKVRALITAESGGRMVKNPKTSAFGFMQLTDATAKDEGVDSHDPAQNILGGVSHFARALRVAGGDLKGGVATYYDGLNSAGAAWIKNHPRDLSHFSAAARADAVQVQANYELERARGAPIALPSRGAAAVVPPGSAANGDFQAMLQDLRMRVEIIHKNAPGGASVKVSGASPQVHVAAVRTQRAMDPETTAGGF